MSEAPKPGSAFEHSLQAWTEIELPRFQEKLDQQGLELKQEQKELLASRKQLALKTKEFRKLNDNEKLVEMKPLLKLYQNEIDALAAKLKKAESFFFGFYRVIAEAPDPKPLLEASLDAVIELAEAAKLRLEVASLKESLTRTADYDVLKQRLLETEQKAAETLAARLKASEDTFRALLDEKEANWAKVHSQHDEQIAGYKATIEELKTNNEVVDLQRSNAPRTEAALSAAVLAELDLLTRDADLAKKRVYELEKRNEQLRADLSLLQSGAPQRAQEELLNRKVADLEGENAVLLASINELRTKLDSASILAEQKVQGLSRELQQANTAATQLKARLESYADYEEIKEELALLRQLEFGETEADTGADVLLIERNKEMTLELAKIRADAEQFTSTIATLEQQLHSTTVELQRVQMLNQKLENDLLNVDPTFLDNASMRSGMTRMTRPKAKDDLLPIVTNQRDRFRDKNKELEEELRRQSTTTSELKRKVKQLQSDNEALYERTRYIASLRDNSSAVSNNRLVPRANATMDLESNPYHASYVLKLHPMEQFRRQEQERISAKLSPVERLMILITRSVLATRTTRIFFFTYCIFLHMVVMITTVFYVNLSTNLLPEIGFKESTGGRTQHPANFN